MRALLPLLLCLGTCSTLAQQGGSIIHLNQLGFYPEGPKVAAIAGASGERFLITSADLSDTLFEGRLGPARYWDLSGETVRLAAFTALREAGNFVLHLPGEASMPFRIGKNVHEKAAAAALKGFYYQRASLSLEPRFAGKWARQAGHPDTTVLIHASAVGQGRPEGSRLSAPGGWYDAGDYNKYIVNSGISMGTLLSLYEDFPDHFRERPLDIPESGNGLPDLLDELCWNLRWMLKMQDPADGGVYHKLTSARFEGMIKPAAAHSPRYVVSKSTAATLDFAAVAAQAARVFAPFETAVPGLADSCLRAAQAAWQWALSHPRQVYDQEALNRDFDPDIRTGEYGDRYLQDEFIWAAAELYLSTGDERYCREVELFPDQNWKLPYWWEVRQLGYYSLLRFQERLSPDLKQKVQGVKESLLRQAGEWAADLSRHPYGIVMGWSAGDYVWGSNSVAANQGIALIQAYRLRPEKAFLEAALSNLDYLLGRNPTGFSFLTGFGEKTPQHPHHRISASDGIAEPVPGLLVAGPNPGMQDGCNYPSPLPARAYTDQEPAYASNEIAINWNAPFVYLSAALEVLQGEFAVKDEE